MGRSGNFSKFLTYFLAFYEYTILLKTLYIIGILLVYYWHIIGILLIYYCHIIGVLLVYYWYIISILLVYYCYIIMLLFKLRHIIVIFITIFGEPGRNQSPRWAPRGMSSRFLLRHIRHNTKKYNNVPIIRQ